MTVALDEFLGAQRHAVQDQHIITHDRGFADDDASAGRQRDAVFQQRLDLPVDVEPDEKRKVAAVPGQPRTNPSTVRPQGSKNTLA